MTAKLIPVSEWAVLTFGKHAPCKEVLNRWARMHQFSPEAQKAKRMWFVYPDAKYVGNQLKVTASKHDDVRLQRILGCHGHDKQK